MSQMEANDEVELGENFRPSCLIVRENFDSGEVFHILVVCDNVYR